MAPKVKITREDIVSTALDIVRKDGAQAVNARSIAAKLNCSTQPLFTNFSSMEELDLAVIKEGITLIEEYIKREIQSGQYPEYKASGMAYIRFAKEEKELFKYLYMRDSDGNHTSEEKGNFSNMESLVHNNTGLAGDGATIFHLEMWAVVHGIATMFATNYLALDWNLVDKMLTDVYLGLRKQYGME